METSQLANTLQLVSGLLIAVTGLVTVLSLGTLASLVILVRTVRNDRVLMSAFEKLYASAPVQTQATIKTAGEAITEVGKFIEDITAPGETTKAAPTVLAPDAGTLG